MKRALLIIAKEGFQDVELAGTRTALLRAGLHVTIASTSLGACTGKFGSVERAETTIKDVDVSEYDKIAFIGGPGAAALADDPDAMRVSRDAVAARRIILGAICVAPTILARAGVLRGKRATVWNEDGLQAKTLTDNGAEYTGETVTVDGRIITGNGPGASEEFGKVLATTMAV